MQAATRTGQFNGYVPRVLLRRLADTSAGLVETVEGSVVFIDISGFTPLSERLARSGREGGERLVDAINHCFSTLLADAYENGGSLLKFGGDALLLWFEGAEHPLRACASAIAMRRTARQIGRVEVRGRQMMLRMSAAVHTGSFQMFLVGGSHREFVLAGSGWSTVAEIESAADAGQILVSTATAEWLPDRCLGAHRGPGITLSRAPTGYAPLTAESGAEVDDEVVAGCLSTVLRKHALAGPAPPEHRTATVAFVQFGGLEELIRQDVQSAAAALDQTIRRVQEAADLFQVCFLGSDIAAGGGKLTLSAGAPRAVGDDEERLLLALRHIIEVGTELPVRIGANRGPVFAAEIGPPYRRTYAVMGDTTNLAARLMGKAGWGSAIATDGVLQRSQTNFELRRLEPFLVKGKSHPIEASEVGALARPAAATRGKRLPLVGRDAEYAALRTALEDAGHGRGKLVEIIGETGSGKSRLLSEARELGAGLRMMHTICENYRRSMPYVVWRDLLRQLLGLHWDDSDEVVSQALRARVEPGLMPWLPLLVVAFDVEVPMTPEVSALAPHSRSAKLHEIVLAFLAPWLAVPTLVQIEHAHFMDDASAELLEALAGRLQSSSWVVTVTRRDVADGFAGMPECSTQLTLTPLGPEAMLKLAESTSEASRVPPHVLELAVERAGGSPEFLLDLLAAAAGGSGELPDSVDAAANARIDELDPRDRLLVRRASVLGLCFHRRLLPHVLEPASDEIGLNLWSRLSGVFADDGDGYIRFKRPALAEVAYESLPFRLRRRLHGAVAHALEADLGRDADADPAVLSLHFSRAGDHGRAWKYALLGAERAAERFSPADAARLYGRAIEAARSGGPEAYGSTDHALARAWEQWGESLRRVGEPDAAARAFSQARRLLADDPVAQARLCHRHAQVAQRSESLTAAVRWLTRGLRALEGRDDPEATAWRARLHSYLGGMRTRQARWMEAVDLCRRAIAEAEPVGEREALARASYLLDWALVEMGRAAEADNSRRALEIYRELGNPEDEATVLNNLGMFAYFEGRWDDAVDFYRHAGRCSERAGNPADVAYTDCNVGEILADQGHFEIARTHLERARRIWTATGDRQGIAFVNLLLGRLAVRDGRWEEGTSLLESAVADLRRYRADGEALFGRALMVEAEALGGDPARALRLADELLAADDRNLPLVARARGIAFARL